MGRVLQPFRGLTAAIQGLDVQVGRGLVLLAKFFDEDYVAGVEWRARLEALEISRATWEADVEALVLRAEGQKQAALNAESRSRTMKKSYEEFFDDGAPDSAPEREAVPAGDVDAGEAEGMQPLRVGLETRGKAFALRAKYL